MEKKELKSLGTVIFGDSRFALEEKFFNGLVFLGIFGWLFSFLGNIALQYGIGSILASLGFFFSHLLFYYHSRINHKTQHLQVPFGFYTVAVLVFVWFNSGGIDGGVLYILNVLIGICIIIMERERALIIIIVSFFVVFCLLYIEYYKPHWVAKYETLEDRLVDVGISIFASIMVSNTMIYVIFRNYFTNNQKVQKINGELDKTLQGIKKDLALSAKIQRALLLSSPETTITNLDFLVHFQPLDDVGGDIYSVEKISKTKTRIFLADATGHGIQAALVTMLIYSEFHHWNTKGLSPAQTMHKLNETFNNKYRSLNLFFSCIIVDIDISKKKIIYSSGGHIDQLILRSNGELEELSRTGVIVGFHKKSLFLEREIPFHKGDLAVFFTDGVLEEFNLSSQPFGVEGFYQAIQEKATENLQEISDNVNRKLRDFLETDSPEDDITVLYFRL